MITLPRDMLYAPVSGDPSSRPKPNQPHYLFAQKTHRIVKPRETHRLRKVLQNSSVAQRSRALPTHRRVELTMRDQTVGLKAVHTAHAQSEINVSLSPPDFRPRRG